MQTSGYTDPFLSSYMQCDSQHHPPPQEALALDFFDDHKDWMMPLAFSAEEEERVIVSEWD